VLGSIENAGHIPDQPEDPPAEVISVRCALRTLKKRGQSTDLGAAQWVAHVCYSRTSSAYHGRVHQAFWS